MQVEEFIKELRTLYKTGQTTEHSFRPILARLFDSIDPNIRCINEPQAITKVGRPDFVFVRQIGSTSITVGHCEAKDVGLDINPKGMSETNKAQLERYVKALPNLLYTNGLDFTFYKQGERVREIKIGEALLGIHPLAENFEPLVNQLKDFCAQRLQTISSAETLAEAMAGKAVLIKDVLHRTLRDDKAATSELAEQFAAFREQLIHQLSTEDFSDIYAETIAYGLFAARLHDETPDNFSRQEAIHLLPQSNPFLRKLFEFIAGPNLPNGIKKTVDELAEVFQATDLQKLFEKFGRFSQRNDPFIHFYETFLAKYNPTKRRARGVWYTPEPVVNFIVRAVDSLLKTEFGLTQGLADTSKITVDWDTGQVRRNKDGTLSRRGVRHTEKKVVHRVQILDPAAGTGTFLTETIQQIGQRVKDVAPGQWNAYVEQDLLPRLHGFELLMASYAMCHMKLDMMLTSMGYKPSAEQPPRLGVYLTNSLEEGERVNQTLPFAQWLSNEARQANTVKRDVPVMVVLGNPPYSGESKNKGPGFLWMNRLMAAYKKEPGGQGKLQERNPKWLNDDYVKFIRLAEKMIEENGEGILGFITNHGYLDNSTFRGMRWHLLKTFDKIWILDLHGSSQKSEVPPGAPDDKNVFDIKPGVAILICAKHKATKTSTLGTLKKKDIYGSRQQKYSFLENASIFDHDWKDIPIVPNRYLFRDWDYDREPIYQKGFALDKFMPIHSNGIVTGDDGTLIAPDIASLEVKVRSKHGKWNAALAEAITYRLFEHSLIYLDERLIARSRSDVMRHYRDKDNIGLLVSKQVRDYSFAHIFVTKRQSEAIALSAATATNAMNFPLYLYSQKSDQADALAERRVNMDPIVKEEIERLAQGANGKIPDELEIFDYIYGTLHSQAYRDSYREFLKANFPRIPYPTSPEMFWLVCARGSTLRRLHLMEEVPQDVVHPFKGHGNMIVTKTALVDGAVFINETQRFENVAQATFDMFIGGYQPAQKWLKDRKGRSLSFEDIVHYQKILSILRETHKYLAAAS